MPAAVSSAARRAKRVIESDSEDQDEEMELDDDVEEEEELDEDEDDDDAEGEDDGDEDEDAEADEEEDAEPEPEDEEDAEPEEEEDEIDDDDEEDEDTPQPVKIKLRVDNKRPAKRQAAKKAAKRTKEDADSDDEFRDESRATSPSKMTARQRAKREKELGEDEGAIDEGLMSLPDGQVKVKPILTEAERLQKREEMARRRKRQNEQRLQDEQDQTINRLLRAQTGRSRSKLDHTPLPDGESGASSPTKQRSVLDIPHGIRWSSRLDGENVTMAVSVMEGNEKWLELPEADRPPAKSKEGKCAAKGCSEKRKYRSTKKFDVGGCSLPHLKEVEAAL